ncbi:DNA helicase [Candidatus Desulfarcum epimagneticum]|uniref:DNA 3'-5' helicase n=1 Tax=uncultured Desulfobacteraceae bacterium TaxID=218296 RepID=A0A484HQ36_9BACT|nr:DNA helicase [uncultured Desulfobacteraceae bacterium]
MRFIADFHVHSKFSRATSKNLDLENLYIAARMKGIAVVGTGDFTCPQWMEEIREKLEPAEPGLFKLKESLEKACDARVPASCRGKTRFVLSVEISNIYKKNGAVRKNHNLILAPGTREAEALNARLDKIGNLRSDGRPILGLDARDLLEIMLETTDRGFFIPAHVWTPWFSLFGSKSGFDSIEECFGDLTPHIFALETGLSSDPPMNWRVSALDGLTLVSNSDAHSPMKLGREANLFDADLDYDDIVSAMKTGDPGRFLGTLEFYPEEGKYHLDGHRACGVRLSPDETRKLGDVCPRCGKPLTLGVLRRVDDLADRPLGQTPRKRHSYQSIVPLTDILSEIFKVGPGSKKVQRAYMSVLRNLGPELPILHSLPLDALAESGILPLREAVSRMREGNIRVLGGYDGEFGTVEIFKPGEREALFGQRTLFEMGPPPKSPAASKKPGALKKPAAPPPKKPRTPKPADAPEPVFNARQKAIVRAAPGPMRVSAGPGTGKTRALAGRIAYLIKEKGVAPQSILAVTFTQKAAAEMKARIARMIPHLKTPPCAATFHSFCLDVLQSAAKDDGDGRRFSIIDERERLSLVADAAAMAAEKGFDVSSRADELADGVARAKQALLFPESDLRNAARGMDPAELFAVYRAYQDLLSSQLLWDYEDLIFETCRLFESRPDVRDACEKRFAHILVDECQDLNFAQYRLIRLLAPPGKSVFLIGDPDQSIYGFRGSSPGYLKRFLKDYPEATRAGLDRNYRSTPTILDAAFKVIEKRRFDPSAPKVWSDLAGGAPVGIIRTRTEKAEAEAIVAAIERMTGGSGFFSLDSGRADGAVPAGNRGFSDFAVLFRTAAQGLEIKKAFDRSGMPCRLLSKKDAFFKKDLAPLICLFKWVHDCAPVLDMEAVFSRSKSGVGAKTARAFKMWRYQKGLGLSEAIRQAARLPLPGMGKAAQYKLTAFFQRIEGLRREMSGLSISDRLHRLAAFLKWEPSLESDPKTREGFERLIETARSANGSPRDFLDSLALETDSDVFDKRAEAISLMTMHASKGLEFPVVFIAGCEMGLAPFERAGEDEGPDERRDRLDEERRLFYVAMTRAGEELYLSHAERRMIRGRLVSAKRSGFVSEIDEGLRRDVDVFGDKNKAPRQTQYRLF